MLIRLRKISIVMNVLLVLTSITLYTAGDSTPVECRVDMPSLDDVSLHNDESFSTRMNELARRACSSRSSQSSCRKVAGGATCCIAFLLFTSRIVFAVLDTAHEG